MRSNKEYEQSEAGKAAKRRYYLKHREERIAKQNEYNASEAGKAARKRYYEKNKEKLR